MNINTFILLNFSTKKTRRAVLCMTGGAVTLNKLELPFKIGSVMAVDGSLSNESSSDGYSSDGYKGTFKITLQDVPQKTP
jgi:hypothetical protein